MNVVKNIIKTHIIDKLIDNAFNKFISNLLIPTSDLYLYTDRYYICLEIHNGYMGCTTEITYHKGANTYVRVYTKNYPYNICGSPYHNPEIEKAKNVSIPIHTFSIFGSLKPDIPTSCEYTYSDLFSGSDVYMVNNHHVTLNELHETIRRESNEHYTKHN